MQNRTATLKLQLLEEQKHRAEQDVLRFEGQLRDRIDPNLDEADPGLTAQTVTVALLNNARRKIEAIKQAITHAKKGAYGLCEACGKPIDPERLEIFPQATLCVTCKAKTEKPRFSQKAA